jgi:capsular polysaccharide biosynthesis protein
MELRIYLRMLQRGWWLILLTALVALFIALLSAFLTVPIYRTTARFVVNPNPSLVASQDAITSLEALDKRSIISTYAEFINSERILQETYTELKLTPAAALKYTRTTVVLPDANILELSVTGPDQGMVANIANSLGQRAINYIHGIYQVYEISLLDPAIVPSIPERPQPVRDGILALVLGLVIGVVLAIVREQLVLPLDAYRQRQMTDRISSAFSHRYLRHRLDQEISDNPNGVLSFGLVRLGGLYDLADALPQPVLQNVLTDVTEVLRKELRGNDMVARWADLTFAMLLPATGDVAAGRTLERIRNALQAPFELEPGGDTIQLAPQTSVVTHNSGENATQLVQRAEAALE